MPRYIIKPWRCITIYNNFAYIYDKLIYDLDYKKWADYIESIFDKNGLKPSLVLELGCGTGSFCIEMTKRGYDMIGVDLSEDMLACAKEKATLENCNSILLLNQDMTDFELYGTVDAVVCLLDSINYVTNKNALKKTFKLVKNYLNPGGLFIFDINTAYKLEHVLGNNVFYEVDEDISYIWQNSFDKQKKLCKFDLTFFVKEGELYRKYEEMHLEKAYLVKEIKEMLESQNIKLLNVYDELSFSAPKPKSEKVFFVCINQS